MAIQQPPKVILELPLSKLNDSLFDISSVATPCYFRFVDCYTVKNEQLFRLIEVPQLQGLHYSAVSYVWKGNENRALLEPLSDCNPSESVAETTSFVVKGAEDGDPISIDVLKYACIASLHGEEHRGVGPRFNPAIRTAKYLWLDRLCIIQTNKEDKNWQIKRMFDLYHNCAQCFVLPGGIQRLVPLDEETSWIHRAWTLQEALAPRASFVLFSWKWGEGMLSNTIGDSHVKLRVIHPDQCGMTSLVILIGSSNHEKLNFRGEIKGQRPQSFKEMKKGKGWEIPFGILGSATSRYLSAFRDTVYLVQSHETRDRAIWQSAFCRTSSRPVDMVFSIMGLFGVTLEPSNFGKDDRIGATIALAQAILNNGGSASWIAIASYARPCPQLSTFPEFPHTDVSGKAILFRSPNETLDAFKLIDTDSWFDIEYPKKTYFNSAEKFKARDALRVRGLMDDDGYLTVMRKACIIKPITPLLQTKKEKKLWFAQAVDGSLWEFLKDAEPNAQDYPRTVAIFVGNFHKNFDSESDSESSDQSSTSESEADSDSSQKGSLRLAYDPSARYKFMLVKEHKPLKFHVVSFFVICEKRGIWSKRLGQFAEHSFCIGGPATRLS